MSINFVKINSEIKSNSDDQNSVSSRSKGLDLDLRLREFEISQLTQRNNFFMIFQGVLIAGLVQSLGNAAPIISFCMSFLGFGISILQIGMAGGAKYWQARWEASTRSSEIAIVLELLEKDKLAVQTFTLDGSLLSDLEKEQISEWNNKQVNEEYKVINNPDYIKGVVFRDISSGKSGVRGALDWWVRRLAILPKWSVSRIPIWVGGLLAVFWMTILINTLHFSWNEKSMKLDYLKEQTENSEPKKTPQEEDEIKKDFDSGHIDELKLLIA